MQQLMVKYRCYALDLWGFGDSGKDPSRYSIEQQIDLLSKFMARMGMVNVVLVGHGYGAAIVAQYAVSNQPSAKVHRMFLVSPPLVDAPPNSYQHQPKVLAANTPKAPSSYMADTLMRRPPELEALAAQMKQQQTPAIPSPGQADTMPARPKEFDELLKSQMKVSSRNRIKEIFEKNSLDELLGKAVDPGAAHYEKLLAELRKTDPLAIKNSLDAFAVINTFRDVMEAPAPVCAVLGDDDGLLPKPDDEMLQQLDSRPSTKLVVMEDKQHFPMLEDKFQFVRLLKDFLEAEDINRLEMKEEWRRRKR